MRWNTSSKIHWKRKVIMDEKRRQCCMSDGRGCAHQLRLMTRREKLKLSLLLFWIHYSRRKWHAAIIDFLVYLNKVLLMKSRSQAAHLRTICLTIRRESLCVLSLSLLIAACGLFKDSPALNPWEDKLNWNNKPLCSHSPIFKEMYYYIYYHHTLDFLIVLKWVSCYFKAIWTQRGMLGRMTDLVITYFFIIWKKKRDEDEIFCLVHGRTSHTFLEQHQGE